MAIFQKNEIVLNKQFDPRTCRHTLNGHTVVLHCHHYASLYTQLANDCGMLDAKALLSEVTEASFLEVLNDYFAEHPTTIVAERISIAEQLYAVSGLGKMRVTYAGTDGGGVELSCSHLDAGWIKKWGNATVPLNFITQGFIAALFSATFGRPEGSYQVIETKSIVCGASCSAFTVVAK